MDVAYNVNFTSMSAVSFHASSRDRILERWRVLSFSHQDLACLAHKIVIYRFIKSTKPAKNIY